MKFRSYVDKNIGKQRVFTLKDPLSGGMLKWPGRGWFCEHVECFDIEFFLQINKNE